MQSMTYLKRMGSIANLFIVLSKKNSKKYKFLTDLYSAEKMWRVFLAEYKSVKNLYFWELCFWEHDKEVGYGTHSFQVCHGLHS